MQSARSSSCHLNERGRAASDVSKLFGLARRGFRGRPARAGRFAGLQHGGPGPVKAGHPDLTARRRHAGRGGARWAVDPRDELEQATRDGGPGEREGPAVPPPGAPAPRTLGSPFSGAKPCPADRGAEVGAGGQRWTFDQNTATEDQCRTAVAPPHCGHARVAGGEVGQVAPAADLGPVLAAPPRPARLRQLCQVDTNVCS
jgi:hypothetical protein